MGPARRSILKVDTDPKGMQRNTMRSLAQLRGETVQPSNQVIHAVLVRYVTKGGRVSIDENEGYALAASGVARITGPKGRARIEFLCGCEEHIYNQPGARHTRRAKEKISPRGGLVRERNKL